MKVWLCVHEKISTLGLQGHVIDVSFGSMKFGNMRLIYQMHTIKEEIKRLQAICELKNIYSFIEYDKLAQR